MHKRHSNHNTNRSNRRDRCKGPRRRDWGIKTGKHGTARCCGGCGSYGRSRRRRLQLGDSGDQQLVSRNLGESVSERLFPGRAVRRFRSIQQCDFTDGQQFVRPGRHWAEIQQYLYASFVRGQSDDHRHRPRDEKKHGNVVQCHERRGPLHLYRCR